MPDVTHISFGDAIVNKVGVKVGEIQTGDSLDEKHQNNEIDLSLIWAQISLQDLSEQAGLLLFDFLKAYSSGASTVF